ncbi:MAG: DUF1570 domain-containing protein, partial [Planctomycetaceae bacterium]|nr:DUF1570 domain-containing protein [Planctomycetaceae bacterium]
IVTTEHYVIATSGSRVHAEWTGALLERLQQAFLKFWRNEGWVLMPPTAPLTVVIHGTRADYAAAARSEGGAALIDAHGYYSMRTNRIVLADPTADAKQSVRTVADVQRFVASDSSSLSTIAHEATHQIAFNCGVHTRYADNPVWMTEGLAMMFEIPDSSGSGWKTVGRINRPRLSRFRQSLKDSRTPGALTALIADDERFRNPETAEEAYAEAWAFTSFLMRTRRREWTAYLQECSENTRMRWKTREERTADFERAFGLTAADLESEFLRYVSRLR